jgi:succinate-semialdehyde dehydrogenase/glutarate-semialdehyde dehydrogenase
VTGKYRNAGQVRVADAFLCASQCATANSWKRLHRAAALKVGDGLEDGVQMGPMANARRPEPSPQWSGTLSTRRDLNTGERL